MSLIISGKFSLKITREIIFVWERIARQFLEISIRLIFEKLNITD
jgi:hypothetical protein